MSQTRERLRGRSYAEIVFVGTRFSHPGNLQIDERGIDLAERVVTEFPTLHLPRTVVFAEHRGLGDQTLEEFAALRKAQISVIPYLPALRLLNRPLRLRLSGSPPGTRGRSARSMSS